MTTVIKKYQLLIEQYHSIEKDSTEKEIHDKRVTLRRIFPILNAYKMDFSTVKNGEKSFDLFGKLRDIQVQLMKLESINQTREILEYIAFLKTRELKLKQKVHRYSETKELAFPTIKKKHTPDKSDIICKADKSLHKIISRIRSRSIDDAKDIHKIRIEFKKFRYVVEVLSYIEKIEETKLENLKLYQDKLGEIQDYTVLIDGISRYVRKRNVDEEAIIEQFEQDQDVLIVNFDNEIEQFIGACREVIGLN